MYPLQCTAGYAMPIKTGKFEIVAIGAKLATVGTDSELSIWDTSAGTVIDEDAPSGDAKRIFHINDTGDSAFFFALPEPIKSRGGISIGTITNISPGQLYVYVR